MQVWFEKEGEEEKSRIHVALRVHGHKRLWKKYHTYGCAGIERFPCARGVTARKRKQHTCTGLRCALKMCQRDGMMVCSEADICSDLEKVLVDCGNGSNTVFIMAGACFVIMSDAIHLRSTPLPPPPLLHSFPVMLSVN